MARIFFETHGCSANIAESEAMMGLLKNAGYEMVDDIAKCDVVVLNSCTVKGEDTSLKALRKMGEYHPYKKYIVAGCITSSLAASVRCEFPGTSFVNTHNIARIGDAVEHVAEGSVVEFLSRERGIKLSLPRIRKNKAIGIVPILNGCASRCTFCSVWQVKGQLLSYPEEEILEEVKSALNDGCKEIWVTSQDNGAYNIDKSGKSGLPELIEKICSIDGDFMIRVGMINPHHIIPRINEYIRAFRHLKVFKFLHIPVQAGDDNVLMNMERNYKVGDFEAIVNAFREAMPGITISTDIICGFPGETDEHFEKSLGLVRKHKFDVLNISRFFPSQNTKAARMRQLHGNITKERSRRITELHMKVAEERNNAWLGWEGEIIVDESGKGNTMVGRNFAYKPVVVYGEHQLGEKLKVKIKKAYPHYLEADVI